MEVAAPVPLNPYQRPRKQQPVGGVTNLAAQMVRAPVPVPVKPTENNNLTNENANAILLTNENLQNTSSYLDEIRSLLNNYDPKNGKRIGGDQATKDAKARRDFMSLVGYIDRVERDYIIPDSIAEFIKEIRRIYIESPDEVNEQLMNQISQQVSPMFNEFAQHISRKTLTQLGPKKGGRRTRRNRNRHRQRGTHRRR
jgi:hypothetical protein